LQVGAEPFPSLGLQLAKSRITLAQCGEHIVDDDSLALLDGRRYPDGKLERRSMSAKLVALRRREMPIAVA
jgi:hypothetical protein